MECYVPKDPVTGKLYINAVGSTVHECGLYIGMIEVPEEVLLRLVVVRASISVCDQPNHPT